MCHKKSYPISLRTVHILISKDLSSKHMRINLHGAHFIFTHAVTGDWRVREIVTKTMASKLKRLVQLSIICIYVSN